MADRGTVIAYDAEEVVLELDAFEHVMEPTAAFGAQFLSYDVEEIVLLDAYEHVMEPTAQFGNLFIGVYFGPW